MLLFQLNTLPRRNPGHPASSTIFQNMHAGRAEPMGVTEWTTPASSELEDIQVTNGPDLHVLLSAQPDPMTRNELHVQGYIDVGTLKGNIGSQNPAIPQGANVNAHHSIVISCMPFGVIFSVAPLGRPKHVSGAQECPPLTSLQALLSARRLPDNRHRPRRR